MKDMLPSTVGTTGILLECMLRSSNHSYSLESISHSSITVFLRCLEEGMEFRNVRRVRIMYFPNMSVFRNNFHVHSEFSRYIYVCKHICTHAYLYVTKMYYSKSTKMNCVSFLSHVKPLSLKILTY